MKQTKKHTLHLYILEYIIIYKKRTVHIYMQETKLLVGDDEKSYVRIKINHSRENKVKGFYLLMTNGNTYSDKKDEFIVEKRFLKLLDENGITYQQLLLNPEE